MKYKTHSQKETQKLAKKLAKNSEGNIYALIGDLGAGKTSFVQGFAKGLGIKDKIISPTFVLMRQYKIPRGNKFLYHIDLYRIEDINQLGIKEIMENPNNYVIIEWAEKIKNSLPKNSIKIFFEVIDKTSRQITLS